MQPQSRKRVAGASTYRKDFGPSETVEPGRGDAYKSGSTTHVLCEKMLHWAFALAALAMFVFVSAGPPLLCPSATSPKPDQVIPWNAVRIYGEYIQFDAIRALFNVSDNVRGTDISIQFDATSRACDAFIAASSSSCASSACFASSLLAAVPSASRKRVFYEWAHLESSNHFATFNGVLFNLTAALVNQGRYIFSPSVISALSNIAGRDATLLLNSRSELESATACLLHTYSVGFIRTEYIGCAIIHTFQVASFALIMAVIGVKLVIAAAFHLGLSTGVHKKKSRSKLQERLLLNDASKRTRSTANPPVIFQVTCYSESEASIRQTLESLASTDYPDSGKLLFVVADGLVTGAGNAESTPNAILNLMSMTTFADEPLPKAYISVCSGRKRVNHARVFSGCFIGANQVPIPMIAVVKCGSFDESGASDAKKIGNRGKRDSQMILMNLLSHALMDDAMTALDHELMIQINRITPVHMSLESFQFVLMVDADTVVEKRSLHYLMEAMNADDRIIGACGETQISNKLASWVTAIQVFEYFLSHHWGKAFESAFGGVTCLPGCFALYRIKVGKGPRGAWTVPVLCNPDILHEYGERHIHSLHKKNLMLLGEDRYLTTLMLRTFPNRKLIFVQRAVCWTVVPETLWTLMSQRRRWINSTVHNLMELMQMRDLCGVFCCGMRFLVLLEFIGTVVLPAAFPLFATQMIMAAMSGSVPLIPVCITSSILFLPGILISILSCNPINILWMIVYFISLPIWTVLLPLWAFWNIDDYGWGETRKIQGDTHRPTEDLRISHESKLVGVAFKTKTEWDLQAPENIYNNQTISLEPDHVYVSQERSRFHPFRAPANATCDGDPLASSTISRESTLVSVDTKIAVSKDSPVFLVSLASSSSDFSTTREGGHRVGYGPRAYPHIV
ncbi:hypothetical protein HDU78_003743 [Chytriomyces hyalinus]|nr:hypothetical protein HDU78_003743 [Chytriomyces hyalinus]